MILPVASRCTSQRPPNLIFLRVFDALDFPGKTFAQPGVGFFHLVAVVNALMEHAIAITNAIACNRQRERRTAIQETGRESTQTAIAKPGVVFALADVFQIQPDAFQRIAGLFLNAEIQQCISQQTAHQEFERQVGDTTAVVGLNSIASLVPALHQAIPGSIHNGLVEERRVRLYRAPAKQATKIVREVAEDCVCRHWQSGGLQQLAIAGCLVRFNGHAWCSR